MKLKLKAKNTQITDALNDYVYKRLGKLEKYFTEEMTGTITLIVEQHSLHKVEATIPIGGYILRAEAQSNDMYASIDAVEEKLERQIRKYKTRINRKSKETGVSAPVISEEVPESPQEGIEITRTKHFAVKPMSEEEAIMQMELLSHDFFVFQNGSSNEINVVYKRKDGNYGIIIPELS